MTEHRCVSNRQNNCILEEVDTCEGCLDWMTKEDYIEEFGSDFGWDTLRKGNLNER